jgi:hypothetical protein
MMRRAFSEEFRKRIAMVSTFISHGVICIGTLAREPEQQNNGYGIISV